MAQTPTVKQQYWSEVLDAAESSGLSIAEFARVNHLGAKNLYRWRDRLKSSSDSVKPPKAQFAQVVATNIPTTPCLSVKLLNTELQFNALPDPDWLATLLAYRSQPA